MPITAIVCGILLSLIGVIGYAYATMNGTVSLTALIPLAFGSVLEVMGAIAIAKENLRKHLMHAAVMVALLGFIATGGRLLMKLNELTLTPAVLSQIAMALVCLVFVILAIRSFAAARRNS